MPVDVATIEHADGHTWWHEARRPRRLFHRHAAQTRGLTERGDYIERCACGAMRYTSMGGWFTRGKPRFRGWI